VTTWSATVGEILDASAEALICSANPQLNLSGGVGGALGLRYGGAMQQYLRDWLSQSGSAFVSPGGIAVAPSLGLPFKVVVHAVAIDAFYETSPETILAAYEASFAAIAGAGCKSVAAACLACGYGRISPQAFASAIKELVCRDLSGVDYVAFISTNPEVIRAIQNEIASHAGKNCKKDIGDAI